MDEPQSVPPTYTHPIPRFFNSLVNKLLKRDVPSWKEEYITLPSTKKEYFSQDKPFEPETPLHVGPWPHGGYHPPGPRLGPGPHNPPKRKESTESLDRLIRDHAIRFSRTPQAYQPPKRLPENYTLHARIRNLETEEPVSVQQATGYQLFPG